MKTRLRKIVLSLKFICIIAFSIIGVTLQEKTAYAEFNPLAAYSNNTSMLPLSNFYTFTPWSGNVKALVFMVEFADVSFEDAIEYDNETVLLPEELQESLFGEEDKTAAEYPYESVKAYYERASYNKLHFDGKVLYYKALYNRDYYDTLLYYEENDASIGYETLMMEVTSAFEDSIDFSDYDVNKDGVLDAIYLSVPTNGTEDDDTWWGNQSTWWVNPEYSVDNETIAKYVILDGQPLDDNIEYYNQVWIHETGHLLGLADYYHLSLTEDDNWEGFIGEAGHDIMDEMYGDHNAFSKLMCGWIGKENVQVADYSKAKSTFVLKPYEEAPSALIIPIKKWDNNLCSEYYLVEYDKGTKNNAGLLDKTGLRIWHVDAGLINDWWITGYKMFAYEQNITGSKRALLTLMGKKNNYNFYHTGDTFDSKSDTNAIYHVKKGSKVIEAAINFSIKVGKLTKTGYTVTVTRK